MPEPLEIIAEEMGAVAARIEREIRQQFETALQTLRAQVLEAQLKFAGLESDVRQLMSTVKNGEQGPRGERGEKGDQGIKGDQGEPGQPGEKGDRGDPGERGDKGERGEDGKQGEKGESIKGEQGEKGEKGERGEPGEKGQDGAPGQRGDKGEPGRDGADGGPGQRGEPGERGERGEPGKDGRLPVVKQWIEGVHYEGDVVVNNGSTYQALRDTGREPPHDDWACLASRGADAYAGEVKGLYDAAVKYRAMDIVTKDDSEWRAVHDDPGPLPGPGWRRGAGKGKPGQRGERGDKGLKGDPGIPGVSLASWKLITKDYTAIPIMDDGSEGKPLQLKDLFHQFLTESQGES